VIVGDSLQRNPPVSSNQVSQLIEAVWVDMPGLWDHPLRIFYFQNALAPVERYMLVWLIFIASF